MSKFYSLFHEIIVFFSSSDLIFYKCSFHWYGMYIQEPSQGISVILRTVTKSRGPSRPCKLMLLAIALSLSSRCYPINSLSCMHFVMSDSETESSPIISEATNRDQRLPSKCLLKEPRIPVNHYLSSVRRTHRQKLVQNWSPRCSGPSKRTLIR